MRSSVVKRSIVIDSHKTSVSLENEFWDSLKDIAKARETTLSKLISAIGTERKDGSSLSSAIRLHVLNYYAEYLDSTPPQSQ
jgi:predicted DNA-binding ribbon-helix-helix protein